MKLTLTMTAAQVRGLAALASEGAEGLLNDAAAAKAYIGDARAVQAAREGLDILHAANAAARAAARPSRWLYTPTGKKANPAYRAAKQVQP